MTAEDTQRCAEADAMPATLADLLLIEQKVKMGAMLNPSEAGMLMGISPRQVRVQISAGNLPARRISRKTIAINPSAVMEWKNRKGVR